MSYYNLVDDGRLNYRDNRDRAAVEVRNLTRRVLNKVNAHIGQECATAELENREVRLDLSQEGIRRLIVDVTMKELGGARATAIESDS